MSKLDDILERLEDRHIVDKIKVKHFQVQNLYAPRCVNKPWELDEFLAFADEYFQAQADAIFVSEGPIKTGTQALIEMYRSRDPLSTYAESDIVYKRKIAYNVKIKAASIVFRELSYMIENYAVELYKKEVLKDVGVEETREYLERFNRDGTLDLDVVKPENAKYIFMSYFTALDPCRAQIRRC